MTAPQKPEPNSLVYWWNELLFTRYFEYETHLDPEDIAAQLEQLAYRRDSMFWGTVQTVDVDLHPNGKGLNFDVQRKLRRKYDLFGVPAARAQGTVRVDSATGQALVSGTAKMGRSLHLFLLLYAIYLVRAAPMMLQGAGISAIPFLAFITLFFGGYWRRLYLYRNEIVTQTEQALTEKHKRDHSDADVSADDALLHEDDLPSGRLSARK